MQAVIESVDLLTDIDRFISVPEKEGQFVVAHDVILQQENILAEPIKKAANEVKKSFSDTTKLIIIIFVSVLLIILLLLIFVFRQNLLNFFKFCLHLNHKQTDIEMNQVDPKLQYPMQDKALQSQLFPVEQLKNLINNQTSLSMDSQITKDYDEVSNSTKDMEIHPLQPHNMVVTQRTG